VCDEVFSEGAKPDYKVEDGILKIFCEIRYVSLQEKYGP
jgi:hypothetical protein